MAFTEILLGKRERLSWVAETSWGAGGTMSSGEIVGHEAIIRPRFSQNFIELLQSGADDLNVQGFADGPLDLLFELEFSPTNWRWMKYLRKVVDAGGPTYTHTFTERKTIQSFKLEWAMRHTTPVVATLTGCAMLKAELRWSKSAGASGEGMLKVVARCVAKAISVGASVTELSDLETTPFMFYNVKATLDNSEVVEVNSGSLILDLGIKLEDSRYANSTLDRALGEVIPGTFRVGGSLSITQKDNTHINNWDGAVAVSNCKLEFIRSATDKMLYTFSNFRYISPGMGPTNFNGQNIVDVVYASEGLGSTVATDAVDVY